jgi:rRNA-processing protein FCF1
MTKESKSVRKKLRIILDSNALFVPLQFNIDIFEELKNLFNRNFELVLLPSVKRELEMIASQGKLETRKRAAIALHLAEKCALLETARGKEDSTDDSVLQAARKYGYPVFTNDRQLRNRLRDINVPVIYVRQKSRLAIDGRI